jgi:hypothetical protein
MPPLCLGSHAWGAHGSEGCKGRTMSINGGSVCSPSRRGFDRACVDQNRRQADQHGQQRHLIHRDSPDAMAPHRQLLVFTLPRSIRPLDCAPRTRDRVAAESAESAAGAAAATDRVAASALEVGADPGPAVVRMAATVMEGPSSFSLFLPDRHLVCLEIPIHVHGGLHIALQFPTRTMHGH